MSTATMAAPAAKTVPQESKTFTLGQGESHAFRSRKLSEPLTIKVLVAEVGSGFMQINGIEMKVPWLKQTVAPPPDQCSHQSARLRGKIPVMPRSDYRWTYTIPGVARFTLSETEQRGKPVIQFEVDSSY